MASEHDKWILLGIGVIAAVMLLYSVLIAQQILAWFGIVFPFLFLYLVWRFVRAHERIADALEAPSKSETDETRPGT